MPANKHKRKASAHSKPKVAKDPGLITSNPKAFGLVGLFFIAVSLYLLAFESQNNAMFGVAMLSLVAGVVLAFLAKVSVKKQKIS
jgi:hypothetical protein